MTGPKGAGLASVATDHEARKVVSTAKRDARPSKLASRKAQTITPWRWNSLTQRWNAAVCTNGPRAVHGLLVTSLGFERALLSCSTGRGMRRT